MHVMIIVTAIIVAAGIAVGLICQFVAGGYFNYGADYKSYDSVVVTYAYIDYKEEDAVKTICEDAFADAGIKYYSVTAGDCADGRELVYSFSQSVDAEKIKTAASAINGEIGSSGLSNAYYHSAETLLGGGYALTYGAIALASAVAFQFIYIAIRYKLAMAFAALLADVHNLVLFVSLLTITRIPVGSTVFALAALTVIATMIGSCFLFDRVRKNSKSEKFEKSGAFEVVDVSAGESFANSVICTVGLALAAVLIFVLASISAMSVTLVLTVTLGAIVAAISCVYGTCFFTPAVYSRFKLIGDNFKAKYAKSPSKKSV